MSRSFAVVGALVLLSACTEPQRPGAEPYYAAPATAAVAADTCGAATYEQGPLPFVNTSTTSGLNDDYDMSASGLCAGDSSTQYNDTGIGPDKVYLIRTDRECNLDVQMQSVAADMNVAVVTDCSDLAGSCLGVDDDSIGGDPENVFLAAAAETDYYVIVDGYGGDAGSYTLTITELDPIRDCQLIEPPVTCNGSNDGSRCITGNECTDGTCASGVCAETNDDTNGCSDGDPCTDDVCSAGACAPSPATRCDKCDGLTPTEGTLPFSLAADSSTNTDDFNLSALGACDGGGLAYTVSGIGPEDIYLIQVDRACSLRVTVDPVSADMNVGVFTACGDASASCLRFDDEGSNGGAEEVDFAAEPLTNYYIVADGYDGGSGPYLLTIDEYGTTTGCELGAPVVVCDGTNDGGGCDDGNPCTRNGTCNGGACDPGPPYDAGVCDDGNPCTDQACSGGVCVPTPNDANTCDDGDGCTVEACVDGSCEITSNPACSVCDATSWTVSPLPLSLTADTTGGDDHLYIGALGDCAGGGDSVSSTVGVGPEDVYRLQVDVDCELELNLLYDHIGVLMVLTDCREPSASCIELKRFSSNPRVELSAVAGTDYLVVVDGNDGGEGPYELVITETTETGCSLVAPTVDCTTAAEGARCDDGNPCTGIGSCSDGVCVALPDDSGECDDANPCTDDACVAGSCTSTNDDTNACSDGNPCTDDACFAGDCDSTDDDTNICSDGTPCTIDACSAGDCVGRTRDCSSLDDTCQVGACNAITGLCEAEGANDGGGCDDDDPCTLGDVCAAGLCAGAPLDCTGLDDVCVVGQCNPGLGQCEPTAPDCTAFDGTCLAGACNAVTGDCEATPSNDGTACDDGDACTDADTCSAEACAGTPRTCTAACNTGTCDPISGACVFTAADEGQGCDDGDACTVSDTCQDGTCTGSPRDCTSSGPCSTGACDPSTGECIDVPLADGDECDDGDPCTKLDTCTGGACAGTPKDCAAFTDECNTGSCDPTDGRCAAVPVADGTACTRAGACPASCQRGLCVAPESCDADDGGPTGGDGDAPPPSGGCGCGAGGDGAGGVVALGIIVALRRRRRREAAGA